MIFRKSTFTLLSQVMRLCDCTGDKRNYSSLLVSPMMTKLSATSDLKSQKIGVREESDSTEKSEKIIKSPYGTLDIPDLKLHECVFQDFGPREKKIAVECSMSGRKYTYGKLRDATKIMAAALQNKMKMTKGDKLAIYLPNVPEFPIILLACSFCGIIATTINSTYKHLEIAKQIEDSESKLIFTMVLLHPIVTLSLQSLQKELPVIVIKDKRDSNIPEGTIDFIEMLDPSTCGDFKKTDIDQDDVVVMPYSSGTTGLPKGVQLTHKNMVANLLQTHDAKARFKNGKKDDIVLGILPTFHIYGMTVVTFSTLYDGDHLIFQPKFDPIHFVRTIVKRKVTMLYLVPPLILFLSNFPLVRPYHLKRVEYIVNGASSCGKKDFEKLRSKAKHVTMGQGYGLTETSPVVLLTSRERIHKYGSAGVPVMSTEVKVVDMDTSEEKSAGQRGELWIRGPQVMKGYFKHPEADAEVFPGDGWIKTGDVVYYDDDGDFYIVDRIKDMIKVKGYQVPPAELEEILRSHPKIVDAAVVGVPHTLKGEVPKAYVILKQGKKATEEEIKLFVKELVADHKQLSGGVVFVKSIPKSASGKILKKDLK